MDSEPTHAIPRALERKLIEAREWRDKHASLGQGECDYDLVEESLESANAGLRLLAEIVEAVEDTWGYAEPLT